VFLAIPCGIRDDRASCLTLRRLVASAARYFAPSGVGAGVLVPGADVLQRRVRHKGSAACLAIQAERPELLLRPIASHQAAPRADLSLRVSSLHWHAASPTGSDIHTRSGVTAACTSPGPLFLPGRFEEATCVSANFEARRHSALEASAAAQCRVSVVAG
jgi:hypothetical protein